MVTVLLFTELKHTFAELAQRMKNDEMITLCLLYTSRCV